MRTFLALKTNQHLNIYVSTSVLHDLLPSLRVLALSLYGNIYELPSSIGNLIHLRYLNLSWTEIKRPPAIVCTLYNLQTLLLSNCSSLTELSADMRTLINLCHLGVSQTKMEEIPVKITSENGYTKKFEKGLRCSATSLLLHVINDHTNLLTNPITVLLKSFQQSHVPKEVVFVQALTESCLC